jgi:hypothetical protein
MKLPGGERAVVDIEKLRDYCLSSFHPRGRHKARVFADRLGLTAADASRLRTALLEAAKERNALIGERDGFGRRFVVEFVMEGSRGPAMVRSAWIIRNGEDFPRLTSCYVI